MTDYREYLQQPGNWEWIERETLRLGSPEAFYRMRKAMQMQLLQIPVGKFLSIDCAQPENREMFVKICCEWLTLPSGRNYCFNKLITRIYHDKEFKPVIATADEKE